MTEDVHQLTLAMHLSCCLVPFQKHSSVTDTPPPRRHRKIGKCQDFDDIQTPSKKKSWSIESAQQFQYYSQPYSISSQFTKPVLTDIEITASYLKNSVYPKKVILFPDEGWARSASSSYWTLTPYWWTKNRCKIVEVTGTKRFSTNGRIIGIGSNTLYILGSFKRLTTQSNDSDFKLYLTSNILMSDYNMGYIMTGTLERGCKKTNSFQMTHFAVVCRKDCE